MEIDVRSDAAAAVDAAAERIARRLLAAVRARGVASLALSGGSTGGLLCAALAQHDEVPWGSVDVLQVDERVAPDGHPDRNAVDLVAHLATAVDLPPRRLHLMPVTVTDLRAAARRYARTLGDAPIDVVHLGLGDDGHTASWPPGDPVVGSARPVELVGPFNGRRRMTLTPPIVNAARTRVVLVTGAAKAAPLRAWLDGDRALTVASVRRAGTVVVADRAAAPPVTPTPRPSNRSSRTG